MRIDPAGNVVPTESPGPPVPAVTLHHSERYVVQVTFASCPKPPNPFPPQVLTVSDAHTGATVWSAQGSNFSPTTVAAGDGLIITASGAYPLAGCGAPTCGPLWRPAEPGSTQPIVIGPGADFFVQRPGFGVPTGEFFALSKATGQISWRAPYQGISAHVAVDDEYLFVSDSNNGRLLAFDVDGCGAAVCTPVWSAAVGEGHLLVVSGTGEPGRYRLTAFRPTAPA